MMGTRVPELRATTAGSFLAKRAMARGNGGGHRDKLLREGAGLTRGFAATRWSSDLKRQAMFALCSRFRASIVSHA